MQYQYPNQISIVALDDSRHFEEKLTRPFNNISLLPVLLGDQVFREPYHTSRLAEHGAIYHGKEQAQRETPKAEIKIGENISGQKSESKRPQQEGEKQESRSNA